MNKPETSEPGLAAIGIDIGGSKIAGVVVDTAGRVVDTEDAETPGRSVPASAIENALVGVVERLFRRHGEFTLGIGAAGFVDRFGEEVRFAPHLPWRDEPLAARLVNRLGDRLVGRIYLDNDANAALWGEARFGSARGFDDVVMVTVGTGIGGAVMLGGKPIRGKNGMAGEFGHTQVEALGRMCECGQRGCWEQYASGPALTRLMMQSGSDLRGADITAAALAGNEQAMAAYAEVGSWLGLGMSNLVASLDPELVVIGGGLSSAEGLLLEPAWVSLSQRLVGREYRTLPQLCTAELGPLAGAIGAADLARNSAASLPGG